MTVVVTCLRTKVEDTRNDPGVDILRFVLGAYALVGRLMYQT